MTPRQCWLFSAVSGPFFSEKCRNFCGQILPFALGPFFRTSRLSAGSGAEKEKKGRERTPTKLDQTVRLHQQLCTHTHTHTQATQAEGRRRAYLVQSTLNSKNCQQCIAKNKLLEKLRVDCQVERCFQLGRVFCLIEFCWRALPPLFPLFCAACCRKS